ncbi:MAG: hypothetical protein KF916_05755 [Microbacteriaceae bacterium]|nr:hypothetical protein [Microbacteriaceae bacterium]
MAEKSGQKIVTIGLVLGLIFIIVFLAIGSIFAKDTLLPGEETSPSNSQSTAPATDEPSQTPEPTNTESPTTEPSEKLEIVKMTPADGSFAGCSGTFGTQEVTITWESKGAKTAFIGLDTDNAKAQPLFSNLPASGSQVIDFPCSFGSSVVTVTVESSSGDLAHKSITLTN